MRARETGLLIGTLFLALPAAGGDTQMNHLIYLHGRIIQEQQDPRPQHPRFGHYELEKILDTFRARGFTVSGEIRPKAASVGGSADAVVARVRELLESGVPPERITVLGGSMGGGIALVVSARLQNPRLRFAVLGVCLSDNVRAIAAAGPAVSGQVLAIREASDDFTRDCAPWETSDEKSLVAREIVLNTGLEHGFLYQPLADWVDPVLAWARPE